MPPVTEDALDDASMPLLFSHAKRKDWGVGVLAWEAGGKRGYLFEDGEERTMAAGFHQLMLEVKQPSSDQREVFARLQRVVAGRANAHHATVGAKGPTILDQISRLRKTYPEGLLDPKWVEEVRGEGATTRAPQHRAAATVEAAEQLSAKALDALIDGGRYEKVWELVASVLKQTDLVPKAHVKKPVAARTEQHKELAVAVRELLHGQGPYEARFDRFVAAMAARHGETPRWEQVTAPSALVHPTEHLCVHPTAFRQQLKVTGIPGSLPSTKPTGAGYARYLAGARIVAKRLAEQGEVTRDLLDVLDFVRFSFKAVPKVRPVKPKAPARVEAAETSDEEQDPSED